MRHRRRPNPRPPFNPVYVNGGTVEGVNELPVDRTLPAVESKPGSGQSSDGRVLYIPVGEPIELVNELPIDPSIGYVESIDYSKLPPDGPEYLRQKELAAAFEAGRRAGLAEAAAAGSPPPPAAES